MSDWQRKQVAFIVEDGLTEDQACDLVLRGWSWWTYLEVVRGREGGSWL